MGYLGDRYFGSQIQADQRTVEGEFVAACLRADLFGDYREARFLAACRTDRGVHARGQVIAFTTRYPERAVSALPWQLPDDIWITGWNVVEPAFHPRYRALSRTYRYYFGEPDLDLPGMQEAAGRFIGCHDFSRFARVEDRDPFRNVTGSQVFLDEGIACFEVTAESFLWHMVRNMASVLILVGRGEWIPDEITLCLEHRNTRAISPASPGNLVLWNVDCGMQFIPVRDPGHSLRFIRGLKENHAVMAKICGIFEADRTTD